ncbi:three-Cys-motif partner protein TcmP [Allokutzneria albata]|uniref:Three-Cys-motif partner protein n=1 Tax=Allokutzneria albata TaxID=211114 RepID=A0A1G9S8F2_ALLAB|nr:three-Cys-motif partner protein TcmP [Allokutzneria albata]SDM31610.1 three-Cys-motif partner protein [Allokutzneria albata]
MTRLWGWWTEHKLQILEDYLQAFAVASSGTRERIYLDLFAGLLENRSRENNEEIFGSVHRALKVRPPFTHIQLFELPAAARRLETALRDIAPGRRNIRVHHGDCNRTITSALEELAPVRWAPTFAFVDQYAAEVHWSTLEQVAKFRRGKTKAEMWILFGTSFLPRGLEIGQEHMNAEFGDRLTDMYGSEEWQPIVHAQRRGILSPMEARFELVNLMRWRLERELGYKETHAFTMKNTGGADLYHMIFVSDHHAGNKIMRHLYKKALSRHEEMRQQALTMRRIKRQEASNEAKGLQGLFEVEPSMVRAPNINNSAGYIAEPPREPYQLR